MGEMILDYSATVSSSRTGERLPTDIPVAPGLEVVQTTVVVPVTQAVVECFATLAIAGTGGRSIVRALLYRDGSLIFFADQGVISSIEQFYIFSFQHIDFQAAPGAHTYSVILQKLGAGNTVAVVGPVVLTAKVIGPLD